MITEPILINKWCAECKYEDSKNIFIKHSVKTPTFELHYEHCVLDTKKTLEPTGFFPYLR